MNTLDLINATHFRTQQHLKDEYLEPLLEGLDLHHRENCASYATLRAVLERESPHLGWSAVGQTFLPVSLFKMFELKSIPDVEVYKILTSSGTTGNNVSRIFLDRDAAKLQALALKRTFGDVLGQNRLPMLVVDSEEQIRKPGNFSARRAGIIGMMGLGKNHSFALSEAEEIDPIQIEKFLADHGSEPFLVFGFTYIIWSKLVPFLRERELNLSNAVLVHSGGWKKLEAESVSNDTFREEFLAYGLSRIHNFYGMVEQIGTVFVEDTDDPGVFYAPLFADVKIRDPDTWRECPLGEPGVVQVISLLPTSYPGHSILTEDIGTLVGVDDGPRWLGRRFRIHGRLPKAEVRGCSDTYEDLGG